MCVERAARLGSARVKTNRADLAKANYVDHPRAAEIADGPGLKPPQLFAFAAQRRKTPSFLAATGQSLVLATMELIRFQGHAVVGCQRPAVDWRRPASSAL